MLITKEVEVKISGKNIKHFKNLGYDCKLTDKFIIPIEHLTKGSHIYVDVKCDYCNINIVSKKYDDYIKQNQKSLVHKDCCKDCQPLKNIETCLIKYGVKNPSQVDSIKEKRLQTFVDNFGVDNPMKNTQIQNKTKQTNFTKYGFENAFQNKEIQNKSKQTCLSMYGVEYSLSSDIVRDKIKNTILEKYGVNNISQNEEIQEKIKQTNLKKYGYITPSKNEKVKEKSLNNLIQSKYRNGTAPYSKQQQYLSKLLKWEMNYPINKGWLDLAFIDEYIYLEYDGSGHNLNVQMGKMLQNQFDKNEKRRYYDLYNNGWKMIRIISLKDYLPYDEIILQIIKEAKEFLNTGHSWIKYDIDNSQVITSQYIKNYNFGNLRKITEKDIESFVS